MIDGRITFCKESMFYEHFLGKVDDESKLCDKTQHQSKNKRSHARCTKGLGHIGRKIPSHDPPPPPPAKKKYIYIYIRTIPYHTIPYHTYGSKGRASHRPNYSLPRGEGGGVPQRGAIAEVVP